MRELFDDCYNLKVRILELDERIEEIQTVLYYPKNQMLSDLPKGGGTDSTLDNLLTKLDELKEEKSIQEAAHADKWAQIVERLDKCNVPQSEKDLLELRFYFGFTWKYCIPIMTERTGEEWNENKVYRIYRDVCEKCTNVYI